MVNSVFRKSMAHFSHSSRLLEVLWHCATFWVSSASVRWEFEVNGSQSFVPVHLTNVLWQMWLTRLVPVSGKNFGQWNRFPWYPVISELRLHLLYLLQGFIINFWHTQSLPSQLVQQHSTCEIICPKPRHYCNSNGMERTSGVASQFRNGFAERFCPGLLWQNTHDTTADRNRSRPRKKAGSTNRKETLSISMLQFTVCCNRSESSDVHVDMSFLFEWNQFDLTF